MDAHQVKAPSHPRDTPIPSTVVPKVQLKDPETHRMVKEVVDLAVDELQAQLNDPAELFPENEGTIW